MERAHENLVEATFGPRARAYVDSAVHSRGADLDALEGIVRELKPARAIDVGCGGGHVSYLLARHAGRVTAADLSSEMLAAVAATAKERGLANLETAQTIAERLPFADGAFDFLATRYSAHHWRDFEGGIRQARRVLKTGGRAAFIDAYSTGVPLLDTHLQAVEVIRDPSHVRDYSAAEWMATLARSGFQALDYRTWRVRMDFPVWLARLGAPESAGIAIRALQATAPAETREHFSIEPDGSFMLDVMMIQAVAA